MSVKAASVETTAAVERLREEFPILAMPAHGRRLAYLDNAATTQKPREVLDAITTYYTSQNANVHRGVHLLSERATLAFEQARDHVAAFFGAVPSCCHRPSSTSAFPASPGWTGSNCSSSGKQPT